MSEATKKVVYKYVFNRGVVRQSFELPKLTLVRSFGIQQIEGVPRMVFWAEVETDQLVTENRTFQIVGTGEEFSVLSTFHGTTMIGDYVFHLYEVF